MPKTKKGRATFLACLSSMVGPQGHNWNTKTTLYQLPNALSIDQLGIHSLDVVGTIVRAQRTLVNDLL